jgi:hypothetical protein
MIRRDAESSPRSFRSGNRGCYPADYSTQVVDFPHLNAEFWVRGGNFWVEIWLEMGGL